MTETLSHQDVIYAFSKTHPPVKKVESGTTIEIDTYDCFQNQVQSPETKISSIDWDAINPATGPIYVNGAAPGDLLKVTIKKLTIGDQGVMVTGPDLGVMGDRLTELESKIIPVENGVAKFNDRLSIPLNPMIGVIGVAPEGDAISCGTPGAHGGNMDTTLVKEGAVLYFPVFAEGALFALGDFHAAMGDGEVGVSGIEVPGSAVVTLDVIKNKPLNHPLLENEKGFTYLVSADTLDEAVKIAVDETADLLVTRTQMSLAEVTMLLSAVGQIQVSQVVDPLVTVRCFVPRYVLETYGKKLLP